MKKLFTFIYLICSISNSFGQTPVAKYSLNGNANDGSGNNHHGTATDLNYVNDRKNNSSGAALFNGLTSKIEIQDTAAFNVGSNTFSLSLWFNTGTQKSYNIAFATGTQGFKPGISLAVNYATNGDVALCIGALHPNPIMWPYLGDIDNSILIHTSNNGYNDSAWHHVAVVLDKAANTLKMYVDNTLQKIEKITTFGTPAGTISTSKDILDITGVNFNTLPTHIGLIGTTPNTTTNQSFEGKLDEIIFYSVALTPAQVQSLYQDGAVAVNTLKDESSNLTLSPNPANDKLYITGGENLQFKLFDLTGKEIKSGTTSSIIDLLDIKNGVYYISLYNQTQFCKNIKFIRN